MIYIIAIAITSSMIIASIVPSSPIGKICSEPGLVKKIMPTMTIATIPVTLLDIDDIYTSPPLASDETRYTVTMANIATPNRGRKLPNNSARLFESA